VRIVRADVPEVLADGRRDLQHRLQMAARLEEPGPVACLDQRDLLIAEAGAAHVAFLVGEKLFAIFRAAQAEAEARQLVAFSRHLAGVDIRAWRIEVERDRIAHRSHASSIWLAAKRRTASVKISGCSRLS